MFTPIYKFWPSILIFKLKSTHVFPVPHCISVSFPFWYSLTEAYWLVTIFEALLFNLFTFLSFLENLLLEYSLLICVLYGLLNLFILGFSTTSGYLHSFNCILALDCSIDYFGEILLWNMSDISFICWAIDCNYKPKQRQLRYFDEGRIHTIVRGQCLSNPSISR